MQCLLMTHDLKAKAPNDRSKEQIFINQYPHHLRVGGKKKRTVDNTPQTTQYSNPKAAKRRKGKKTHREVERPNHIILNN